MKRININAYQVALVFKNGEYKKMLTAGKYWLWANEQVRIYDKPVSFIAPIELNILLQDKALVEQLIIVAVMDNEIALQYENGLLTKVLNPGRYAYWKGIVNYDFVIADISKIAIDEAISKATLQNRLLVNYVRTYNVDSYEKALLFVDGKYVQVLQPGVYYWWKNNTVITVAKADTRTQQMEINGQEILTKDKATLRLTAQAQYQVTDIEKAALENKEYERQLYVAFQLSIREYVGAYTLDELLANKDAIAPYILEATKAKAAVLGMEVYAFGIRDVILPGDIREIMNQVLVAEKKAQANSITRREETASTRSLLNTAKLMEENSMLWKLKEMEYVEKIAEKINNITVNGNGQLIDQLKQIFVKQ
ncbi:MAG: slipin family protein [Rhizobacter sp.]|nr:slipin family protein [Ferruginibacter sp.]